jgi:choline dehydrogenase
VIVESADVHDLPSVLPNLLEHPDDVAAMTRAMAFMTDLVAQPRMRPFYGPLLQPAAGEDWATYARSTYANYHHGVGTCRMGPASDPQAVVDGRLRVHGLDNLLIADASVLPVIPHANTNLSAILVGEIAARTLSAG